MYMYRGRGDRHNDRANTLNNMKLSIYKFKCYFTNELLLSLVAVSTESYQYTLGIDTDSTMLFCNSPNNAVKLSDIHWRRQDGIALFPNPLDIQKLGHLLLHNDMKTMECFDAESDSVLMQVELYVQGK